LGFYFILEIINSQVVNIKSFILVCFV